MRRTLEPWQRTRSPCPDGRTVAFDIAGPDDGPVVVLHHAAPGSRRFDPDPAATAAAGVRLVTIDRAGYGGSDPLPAGTVPTIPGYAADAAAVLDHLGVTSAVVAGWSAGGRVAAALAAARPELVAALFIIGHAGTRTRTCRGSRPSTSRRSRRCGPTRRTPSR